MAPVRGEDRHEAADSNREEPDTPAAPIAPPTAGSSEAAMVQQADQNHWEAPGQEGEEQRPTAEPQRPESAKQVGEDSGGEVGDMQQECYGVVVSLTRVSVL